MSAQDVILAVYGYVVFGAVVGSFVGLFSKDVVAGWGAGLIWPVTLIAVGGFCAAHAIARAVVLALRMASE